MQQCKEWLDKCKAYGGVTYSIAHHQYVTGPELGRYGVSIKGYGIVLGPRVYKDELAHRIVGEWLHTIPPSLSPDGIILANRQVTSTVCAGGWIDRDTDTLHADCTLLIDNLDQAMALARLWHQKAIWDFAEQKEIRVD